LIPVTFFVHILFHPASAGCTFSTGRVMHHPDDKIYCNIKAGACKEIDKKCKTFVFLFNIIIRAACLIVRFRTSGLCGNTYRSKARAPTGQ
jgi:hypothetical protein